MGRRRRFGSVKKEEDFRRMGRTCGRMSRPAVSDKGERQGMFLGEPRRRRSSRAFDVPSCAINNKGAVGDETASGDGLRDGFKSDGKVATAGTNRRDESGTVGRPLAVGRRAAGGRGESNGRDCKRTGAARLVLNDSTTTRVVGETVLRDIVYNKDGESLDLYLPVGQAPPGGWPVVVAFPGGGWRWASKKDYGSRASILTHYGFAVAVADYTYSSGNAGSRAWPADFEDVRAAVVWVREHASRFKIDSTKIAAMGESSGAYMANMIGVYPNGPVSANSLPSGATSQTPPAAGETSAKVAAVVDFYGPTNIPALFQDAPRYARMSPRSSALARPSSRSRASASPVNYVAPAIRRFSSSTAPPIAPCPTRSRSNSPPNSKPPAFLTGSSCSTAGDTGSRSKTRRRT